MIITGVAFVLFWALVEVFKVTLPLAAIVVGVAFILLGLVLGERLPTRRT